MSIIPKEKYNLRGGHPKNQDISKLAILEIPDPCYTHANPSFLEGPVILRAHFFFTPGTSSEKKFPTFGDESGPASPMATWRKSLVRLCFSSLQIFAGCKGAGLVYVIYILYCSIMNRIGIS